MTPRVTGTPGSVPTARLPPSHARGGSIRPPPARAPRGPAALDPGVHSMVHTRMCEERGCRAAARGPRRNRRIHHGAGRAARSDGPLRSEPCRRCSPNAPCGGCAPVSTGSAPTPAATSSTSTPRRNRLDRRPPGAGLAEGAVRSAPRLLLRRERGGHPRRDRALRPIGGCRARARAHRSRALRCACDVRNPRGVCCVGDVVAAVKRVAAAVEAAEVRPT